MRILTSLAVLGVLSLSACATGTSPTPPADGAERKSITVSAPPRNPTAVPAPTVPGTVRRLTIADANTTVSVAVGEVFQIALVGVPTAGYLWEPKSPPAFLLETAATGGPTTTNQLKPGFTGGNHWEVFAFKAIAPGQAALVLEQRRPWETDEPPTSTFRVTIQAR
jgi:inhibitor of cysteine peptidase